MIFDRKLALHRPGLASLCVFALLVIPGKYSRATIYNVDYSGKFTSIFDPDGNPGGSFVLGGGINIGDTFSGTFRLNMADVSPGSGPVSPSTASYNCGVEIQSLMLNGMQQLNLTPKAGLAVLNNVDPTITTYYGAGMRESGFDPLPASVDALLFYTDVVPYDSIDGVSFLYEVILATFDPDALALSDIAIPDPLQPLSNSFFIYLETVDGATTAAGFGLVESPHISSVPVPSACLLVCTGVLVLVRNRRTLHRMKGTIRSV